MKIRNLINKSQRGFTLIEILIVIILIGILAVAVLSAINPLEQLKKARDTGRKSDSAELLNGHERYYTTFGCYSWENVTGDCTTDYDPDGEEPDFAAGGNSVLLVTASEMKPQFANRDSITPGSSDIYMTEAGDGQVSVCYEPESTSGRQGGFGQLMDSLDNDTPLVVQDCSGVSTPYLGNTSAGVACWICVPE